MTKKKVKIGVVGVDSGQLVVCDPCYINHNGEGKELNDYDRLLKIRGVEDIISMEKFKQLKYDKGHDGLGVVFDTYAGDGVYPVYATFEDGLIKKVEIIVE